MISCEGGGRLDRELQERFGMFLPFASLLLPPSALFQLHPVRSPRLHGRASRNPVGLFDTAKAAPTAAGESLAFSIVRAERMQQNAQKLEKHWRR